MRVGLRDCERRLYQNAGAIVHHAPKLGVQLCLHEFEQEFPLTMLCQRLIWCLWWFLRVFQQIDRDLAWPCSCGYSAGYCEGSFI